MKFLSSVLVLVALLAVVCSTAAMRVDPRRITRGNQLSYVKWKPGMKYSYKFVSKAAHIETKLQESANPQTALEDLGLFPFASNSGGLTLDCQCRQGTSTLCKAELSNIQHECYDDAFKNGVTCEHLKTVAKSLSANPFWITFSEKGEITDIYYDVDDPRETRGIKKNLVEDLGLTAPDRKDDPRKFSKKETIGKSTYETLYSINPFTLPEGKSQSVGGIVVRKWRTSKHPPQIVNGRVSDGEYVRTGWVYTIIGGMIESNRPAPVPTRVASTEQVKVDRGMIPKSAGVEGDLYILSRVEMDLMSVFSITAKSAAQCTPDGKVENEKETPTLGF